MVHTKYREVFEAARDHHGVVWSALMSDMGVSTSEVARYVRDGRLERVGQGVYRVPDAGQDRLTQYAEAVALVGPGARVEGESVLAMHGLGDLCPAQVSVSAAKRTRRRLVSWVRTEARGAGATTWVDGVPAQPLPDAFVELRGRMETSVLRRALEQAAQEGIVGMSEARCLKKALA